MGAVIAVMALIDDEGLAEMGRVDLVGAQQIDELDLALGRAVEDAGDDRARPAPARSRVRARRPAPPRCAAR